ncbi:MAG: polyprenol phosphomannose-dependent alpha 1,6 mannosyltransferase MptB [Nocardioides sp.]|nr:polyprenol phosphomannose-dependent alpha 1,6 mannosyltransferase MptB [Nocardioides sp.]
MAGLAVVLLGLGLLAAAWLSLCRHVAVAQGEEREDAVHLVRHAAVVWSAPLVLAPPLFSRDGWSYAAQGMLAHVGISPYEYGPGVIAGLPVAEAVDPRWMTTVTPYGPVPVPVGELAAGVTGNPWVLVVAHRLVTLLGLGVVSGLGSGWVHGLAVPATVDTPLSVTTLVGGLLDRLASLLGLGPAPATFLGLVRQLGTVAMLVTVLVVALRWRTGDRAGGRPGGRTRRRGHRAAQPGLRGRSRGWRRSRSPLRCVRAR